MAKKKKFGTFGGVFTPSILTILGVIMYMRMPMISGEAGLVGTLGIIFIAHLISITTGLSVSSIATDKKVKEGGTYFIISRSLGLPIGGTLGLALFVGLSFSVSLYLIGFAESFLGYWDMPMDINNIRIAGTIILILVTIITFISTSLAIKTQYLIMAAIFLSLLSIFFGHHDFSPVTPNLFGRGTGVSLMVLFGIFFPAVTGFEAGVSMSGDLKDAKKSIPYGTISAISVGLFVYIGLAFFFAYTVDGELLATDPKALFKIALVPQLVIAGIWGATLSSALGSILAAPRILQSTALDKITPNIFAKGTGKDMEPRNALLLTFIIAEAGILVGELDVIARVVSVFFITTYGFLNLSAAFESITSADFRPAFRVPSWVSIIGFMACLLVMIQLDFLAMISAILILGILFLILKRRQLVLESGDAWGSVWATLVKTGLRKLNRSSLQIRNWRPNIILFCGQDQARPHLVELASAFAGRLGMYTAFEMVVSSEAKLAKDKRYFSLTDKNEKIQVHQHSCREIYEGMDEISRVYGFPGIEPDTIFMGWSKNERNKNHFLDSIRRFEKNDFNSIFLNYNSHKQYGNKKTIDVWWSGWGNNLTFSLFLLRHFTLEGDWKDANIRLLIVNTMPDREEKIYTKIQSILYLYRVNLEIKIINNSVDKLPRNEIIKNESSDTDLTFIGIPDKRYNDIEITYEEVINLSQHLGTFLLVNSSSRFESFDLELEAKSPEEFRKPIDQEFKLPPLIPSKYAVINDDINRIDNNGQEVLSILFQKAFTPIFQEVTDLTDELINTTCNVATQINKLQNIDDTYRRKKTIIKIKNDFYFRINLLFNDLSQKQLINQKEALENGINWYIERVEADLQKFPARLMIPYTRDDLILKKNDSLKFKLSVLKKRILHPFSKTTIPGKIRYSEIAAFYLRDNRHYYLNAFLSKFQTNMVERYSEVRTIIISVDTVLENLLEEASDNETFIKLIAEVKKNSKGWTQELSDGLDTMADMDRKRLMLEFRMNFQQMIDDLGKPDINYRIRRKRRKKNFYNELKVKNSQFPDRWYEYTLFHANKIYMDVLFQALKSRIKDKTNDFNLNIFQILSSRLSSELSGIKSKLEEYGDKTNTIPELSISISSFDESITLLKDFTKLGKEVLKLAGMLPENMEVTLTKNAENSSGDDVNSVSVPLLKITRFYLEANFIGKTHDQLKEINESLKNSILLTNDILNLTRFNLENIPEDLPGKKQFIDSVIKDAVKKIIIEEEKIYSAAENIIGLIENSLDEVFDKLSAYKIGETLKEYSGFIREYQSKKVRKRFSSYLHSIQSSCKDITKKILYSRSEWILMSRKMVDADSRSNYNQKILNLVEQVSPTDKVLNRLPQFYKNLFSGRSNIGQDFLIRREKDEEMFRTAVLRYNRGYKGGIMIVGERNSGKTAFCRYVTDDIFNREKVYHLFPVYAGSVQVSDFINELQKLTNIKGDTKMIMESLPPGTVVIIHDLELWWERSIQGWEVIKHLINLINDYSSRVLFVVNINPYAFDIMNKIVSLQDAFISVISLKPFDTKEIQEIIINRHRSSGLKFILNNKDEENISEIGMASLFNRYFNYSEGKPGIALRAWLSNISNLSGQYIHIKNPAVPDLKIFHELDEEWKIIIVQLILHKRLTPEKIQKMFLLDEISAKKVIRAILRAGLIEEKRENIFIVNPYIETHLMRVLKKDNLL